MQALGARWSNTPTMRPATTVTLALLLLVIIGALVTQLVLLR